MKEYEYSFKVKSIKPYIAYCIENGYTKESEVTQNRIVYENRHTPDIISRVTKKIVDGKEKVVFDIKNVGKRDNKLKDSIESIPLVVTDDIREIVDSMIKTLDFYEAANNYRTRYVYKKNGVKFEIDDYIEPKMYVVGIEGNKIEVDNIYNELIEKNVGEIINE